MVPTGCGRPDPLISPVFGDFTGLPPLLFQTGHTEVLRDDSVRVTERARAAGAGLARGLPTGSARLASTRDVASRDTSRAAPNQAVRQHLYQPRSIS